MGPNWGSDCRVSSDRGIPIRIPTHIASARATFAKFDAEESDNTASVAKKSITSVNVILLCVLSHQGSVPALGEKKWSQVRTNKI
jgi:hypothetical protein